MRYRWERLKQKWYTWHVDICPVCEEQVDLRGGLKSEWFDHESKHGVVVFREARKKVRTQARS